MILSIYRWKTQPKRKGQLQAMRWVMVTHQTPATPSSDFFKHSQDFLQGWAEREAGNKALGSLVVNFTGTQAGMQGNG